MGKHFSRLILFMITMVVLVSQFQNCAKTPALESEEGDSLSSTVDDSANFIQAPSMRLVVESDEDVLVVGGTCFTGSYGPQNKIIFQLLAERNNPGGLAADAPVEFECNEASLPDCRQWADSFCENGRYYAHIPLSEKVFGSPSGVRYRLKAKLLMLDDKNKVAKEESFETPVIVKAAP